MEPEDSAALIRLLISMQAHQLTIIEDLREFNRQQLAQNNKLEIIISELMRQRRNGNPN